MNFGYFGFGPKNARFVFSVWDNGERCMFSNGIVPPETSYQITQLDTTQRDPQSVGGSVSPLCTVVAGWRKNDLGGR